MQVFLFVTVLFALFNSSKCSESKEGCDLGQVCNMMGQSASRFVTKTEIMKIVDFEQLVENREYRLMMAKVLRVLDFNDPNYLLNLEREIGLVKSGLEIPEHIVNTITKLLQGTELL